MDAYGFGWPDDGRDAYPANPYRGAPDRVLSEVEQRFRRREQRRDALNWAVTTLIRCVPLLVIVLVGLVILRLAGNS